MPPCTSPTLIEEPEPGAPFGAKGVGEPPDDLVDPRGGRRHPQRHRARADRARPSARTTSRCEHGVDPWARPFRPGALRHRADRPAPQHHQGRPPPARSHPAGAAGAGRRVHPPRVVRPQRLERPGVEVDRHRRSRAQTLRWRAVSAPHRARRLDHARSQAGGRRRGWRAHSRARSSTSHSTCTRSRRSCFPATTSRPPRPATAR